MNKFLKKRKMRGFTLVELLIVIIIIGILAGSLLLVAGAGTDKANATKIVSDMRSIKAAAIMKYADDGNWNWVTGDTTDMDAIQTYTDRDITASGIASYDIVSGDNGVWVEVTNIPSGADGKLELMAKDSGIYEAGGTAVVSNDTYYTAGKGAWLKVK